MRRPITFAVFALLLAGPAFAGETKIGPKGQVVVNGKAVIPLGVWTQPPYLFEYWRHLGMNCIVVLNNERGPFRDVPGRDAAAALDAAALNKLGLIVTSDKGPVPADHPAIWGRLDGVMSPRGGGDRFAGAYAQARKRDPNHFVMVNIPIHSFFRGQGADYYAQALRNTDAVISHVWPRCLDSNAPDLRNVARFVDLVRKYSKDRPGGEACIMPDINPHAWRSPARVGRTFPAPTREELRFQIWLALIHGADGVCFFPISFEPFVYAQIPAQNEQELAWNSRLIEKMTPALTAAESNLKIEATSDLKAGLLDWTTRTVGGKHYIFLLNGQREAQTVTLRAPDMGTKWQLYDAVKDAPLPAKETGEAGIGDAGIGDATLFPAGNRVVSPIPAKGGEYVEKLPGLALRIWELAPVGSASASRPSRE